MNKAEAAMMHRGASTIYGLRNQLVDAMETFGLPVSKNVTGIIIEANRVARELSAAVNKWEFRFTFGKFFRGLFAGLPLRYARHWSTDPFWGAE